MQRYTLCGVVFLLALGQVKQVSRGQAGAWRQL